MVACQLEAIYPVGADADAGSRVRTQSPGSQPEVTTSSLLSTEHGIYVG